MNEVIVTGIFGLAGILVGAFISHMSDLRLNNRQMISQYITDKRVQWIQDLRNEIATFTSNVRYLLGYSKVKDTETYKDYLLQAIMETIRSGRKIQLLLNPTDDEELINIIERVLTNLPGAINDNESAEQCIKDNMNQLLYKTQETLKNEWERSKKEVMEGVKLQKGIRKKNGN